MTHLNLDNGQQVEAPESAVFFLHELRELSLKYGMTLLFQPGVGYILAQGYIPEQVNAITKCALHGFNIN